MIVALLFGGLVVVFRSNFWVFKNFSYIFKNTFGRLVKDSKSDENSISPFEAVSTALAGTIGAGNIVGVATAIGFGGPGAIFWMWIASFVCMTTKMVEVTMAVATRVSDDDGKYIGGPMYYIEKGAGSKFLAKVFSFFAFIAIIGTGALVQSNSISESLNAMTGLNIHIGGILIVIFMLLVVVGGIKRIGAFASKIVPIMSVFYIVGCLLILILQIESLLPAFKEIILCAFSGKSIVGGATGSAILLSIRWGLARGIFSNEAGLGTAPMAHATSHTDHPIRQGMWGAIEVFISSMIICTMTALVIITSGLYEIKGLEGAALTAASFSKTLPLGKYIVSLALILFAFTTAVSWCYYGQSLFFEYHFLYFSLILIPFQVLSILMLFFDNTLEYLLYYYHIFFLNQKVFDLSFQVHIIFLDFDPKYLYNFQDLNKLHLLNLLLFLFFHLLHQFSHQLMKILINLKIGSLKES